MAKSEPIPLDLPPGVLKNTTRAASAGRYTGGYHFRFKDRRPQKIGGFVKYLTEQTLGVVHGAYAWLTRGAGNRLLALGTYAKVYSVLDELDDITPIRESGTLGTDPFSVTNGSTTVTVTDASHGIDDENGAYVIFSGADPSALIDRTLGTNIGDLTANGGLAASFDGTASQNTGAASAKAAATFGYIGKTLGTAAPIYKVMVTGTSDVGYVAAINPTVTIDLYGKTGAAPANSTDGTLLGTISFTDTNNESAFRTVLNGDGAPAGDTATNFDHVWVRISHNGAANAVYSAELQIYAYFLVDGEYLATYVNANSYTITTALAAKTTDATVGGAAVAYSYLLNNGLSDSAVGLGVGVGPVGAGTVGTPRTSGGILRELRTWFFDNYGSLLAFLPSGGTVYTWDEPAAAARGVAVTNAPSSARAMFITAERMIVMLGTDDPMRIEWCDRDDSTNWTAGEGSTANERLLQTGNKLVAGTRFPGDGGQMLWSDTAAYGMQFVGSTDFIYEIPVLMTDAGLIAPTAFELARDLIIWMTPSLELMIYDGVVRQAPAFEEIRAWFKGRLDTDKADKITFGRTPEFDEVTVHFPSIDSADGENDEFFTVHIKDWHYVPGPETSDNKLIKRSAHVHFPTPGGAIVMTGTDAYIYIHENTLNADGEILPWRIETGRISIGYGAVEADVNGYIPDLERHAGVITMEIDSFERPNSQTAIDEQEVTIDEGDEIVDFVVGARYAELAWECEALNSDFRFGIPLLDVAPAGASR